MDLSESEAASALREVLAAEARSRLLYRYRRGGAFFILWGVIWFFGYALCDLLGASQLIWAGLVPVGVAGGAYLNRDLPADQRLRQIGIAVIATVFFFALFFVLPPHNERQVPAVIALVLAAAYSGRGLWASPRYLVAGVALAALTLGGYAVITTHFLLWMAVVGGGSMILAGIWMRRV